MRIPLVVIAVLVVCGPAGLAQGPSPSSPADVSPVAWFLDDFPIPSVNGTGIRKLHFYEQVPESPQTASMPASKRLFVLRRPGPPLIEMVYDSAGQLIHAVHNRLPRGFGDTLEVHWRQSYDENGRMKTREEHRIDAIWLGTISRDTTFFTYHPSGLPFSIRIPHRPWLDGSDTILAATNKLSEFRYNRKWRLTKLVKQCDPSDGKPSGLLVVCARDSFLYDGDGRLAEILTYNIREWQTARHFLYDAQGRLKETAVYAGLNPVFYLRWRYDASSRVIECVQESADGFAPPRTLTFGYGPEGVLNRFQARTGADKVLLDLVVEAE